MTCEIMGLALACVGIYILAGLGWAVLALAVSLLFIGFTLGE